MVPPTPGSGGSPTVFAHDLPKNSTVGETRNISLNPVTGQLLPAKKAEVPNNLAWDKPTVVVKGTGSGGRKAIATYISDGDGGKFKFEDGSTITCRFSNIDANEVAHDAWTDKKSGEFHPANPDQPYGRQAKKDLESLILNKEVTVTISKASKGSREYCEVMFEGKDVELAMVEQGSAATYRRFVAPDKYNEYMVAQIRAKNAGLGQWNPALHPDAQVTAENFRRRFDK